MTDEFKGFINEKFDPKLIKSDINAKSTRIKQKVDDQVNFVDGQIDKYLDE
jgi:hypothetical protein